MQYPHVMHRKRIWCRAATGHTSTAAPEWAADPWGPQRGEALDGGSIGTRLLRPLVPKTAKDNGTIVDTARGGDTMVGTDQTAPSGRHRCTNYAGSPASLSPIR